MCPGCGVWSPGDGVAAARARRRPERTRGAMPALPLLSCRHLVAWKNESIRLENDRGQEVAAQTFEAGPLKPLLANPIRT